MRLKQPKKLTRNQKEIVQNHYMNPNEWRLVRESEFYLTIIHKERRTVKSIDKFAKGARKP